MRPRSSSTVGGAIQVPQLQLQLHVRKPYLSFSRPFENVDRQNIVNFIKDINLLILLSSVALVTFTFYCS